MKKTLITLLALSGIAMGETATVNPLESSDNWSHSNIRENKTAKWALDTDNATLTLASNYWAGSVASYSFEEALMATETPKSLTFSLKVTRDASNGNGGFSIAFVGNTKAVIIGTQGHSKGEVYYGVSETVDADAYYFDSVGSAETVTSKLLLTAGLNTGAVATFSGSAFVNASGDTILTLNASSTKAAADATPVEINLGQDFELSAIKILGEGKNANETHWTVSNLSITGVTDAPIPGDNVPEPTTATLSLLALAGLAARRRRK